MKPREKRSEPPYGEKAAETRPSDINKDTSPELEQPAEPVSGQERISKIGERAEQRTVEVKKGIGTMLLDTLKLGGNAVLSRIKGLEIGSRIGEKVQMTREQTQRLLEDTVGVASFAGVSAAREFLPFTFNEALRILGDDAENKQVLDFLDSIKKDDFDASKTQETPSTEAALRILATLPAANWNNAVRFGRDAIKASTEVLRRARDSALNLGNETIRCAEICDNKTRDAIQKFNDYKNKARLAIMSGLKLDGGQKPKIDQIQNSMDAQADLKKATAEPGEQN